MLGLAATLVFIIASLLTGGSDGRSSETPTAAQAGAQVRPQVASTATPTADATRQARRPGRGARATVPAKPTLAAPTGVCDPADVLVAPRVARSATAGRDVALALVLRTVETEACTWRVSPRSVTVRIADGRKGVWSTRHCPRAVPRQDVVVRRAVGTAVRLTWNARESDDGCPRVTEWLLPGDYAITAAALGGEPSELAFTLASPAPETVHVTPSSRTTGASPRR